MDNSNIGLKDITVINSHENKDIKRDNYINQDINFNPKKFKSMIHYIINKCGLNNNVGRTVIYKLLYFSDFNYYELYEKPISGETYIKKRNGPIPKHFIPLKEELIKERKISEVRKKVIEFYQYKYSSLIKPDTSCLNDIELSVIDDVIIKLSKMSANEISNYSHGDLPWQVANLDNELDYEYVFYREPEYVVREYDE